jgi:hypothetical protein
MKNKDFCTKCEPGRFQTAEFVNAEKDEKIFNDGNPYGGLGGLASDCQFCPSGYNQGQENSTFCDLCAIGKYISCKGGSQCWDCPLGRTSQPKLGGIECVAVTVVTSIPIIIPGSHRYGCDPNVSTESKNSNSNLYEVPAAGTEQYQKEGFSFRNKDFLNLVQNQIGLVDPVNNDCRHQNISSMCITWKIRDKIAREAEQGSSEEALPYRFTEGFLVQWSIEKGFPPPNVDEKGERIKTNSTFLMHEGALDWQVAQTTQCEQAEDDDPTNDCKPGYFKKNIEEQHLGPWTYCFETAKPVHMEMIYVRVVGISPIDTKTGKANAGAEGSSSVSTDTYVPATACGDLMYLSQSSHPPNGPGAWTIGAFNPRLSEWRCNPCPLGGDCRGTKRWVDVYAKFGFSRLDSFDFDNRANAFWPCFKDIACLGGKNNLLTSIQVTYYERPPWPSKEEYFLPEPSGENERLDMPQCCSALNPLVDDVQKCKKEGCGTVQQGNNKNNYQDNSCSKRRDVPFDEYYKTLGNKCPDKPCPYSWNGDNRWSKGTSHCLVDLSIRDDFEICNEEMGYRLSCNDTTNGRCRLCRACASPDREGQKWFPMGVSNCYKCPPVFMNTVGVLLAGVAMFAMVYLFLSVSNTVVNSNIKILLFVYDSAELISMLFSSPFY